VQTSTRPQLAQLEECDELVSSGTYAGGVRDLAGRWDDKEPLEPMELAWAFALGGRLRPVALLARRELQRRSHPPSSVANPQTHNLCPLELLHPAGEVRTSGCLSAALGMAFCASVLRGLDEPGWCDACLLDKPHHRMGIWPSSTFDPLSKGRSAP